ncbi:alpha-tocopherol transfer protein-like [Tachypleus tridentatus]|uniref:alpha-tocopherol transfer protein-like n=1 Tax=Tachypleus tridentatus TaxID=6853 RepID=UPI003FD4E092
MEKPEWRARDIQALREMLQEEPNLIVPSDDNFLLRFLRARKFDYDRAFRLIKQYYILRDNNPELFKDFVPSALKDVFSANLEGFLQHRDSEGHAIFVIRGGIWDPAKHSANDIYRANLLCLEKAIEDPATQINGIIALLDLKEFGFHHIRQMSPAHCRRMVLLIQNCFPGRFKGIHIINEPAVFDILFALVKPFLSEKLKNRVCDFFSSEIPVEFGYATL